MGYIKIGDKMQNVDGRLDRTIAEAAETKDGLRRLVEFIDDFDTRVQQNFEALSSHVHALDAAVREIPVTEAIITTFDSGPIERRLEALEARPLPSPFDVTPIRDLKDRVLALESRAVPNHSRDIVQLKIIQSKFREELDQHIASFKALAQELKEEREKEPEMPPALWPVLGAMIVWLTVLSIGIFNVG